MSAKIYLQSPPLWAARWNVLCLALAALLVLAAALVNNLADYDLWGYLAFGKLFWTRQGFPYQDVFSYLPTEKVWIYHEWLTGVLFFPLHERFGGPGLQTLKYLVGFGIAALAYRGARTRGASAPAFFICLILLCHLLAFGFGVVRAQVFTYLFFALELLLLESFRLRGDARKLWALPPLFCLWVNLHGGFVAGLALPGLYALAALAARSRMRPYLLALALATAATLVNPYGLDFWLKILDAVAMPRPDIVEWYSAFKAYRTGEYRGHALLFATLVFLALVLTLRKPEPTDPAGLVLLVTAYVGAAHIRHIVFFAIAFGVYAPCLLDKAWRALLEREDVVRRWRWLVFLASIAPLLALADSAVLLAQRVAKTPPFAVVALSKTDPGYHNDARLLYPRGAVAFIRAQGFKGNLLPEFTWGEYLLWELPECRVAFDGRYETVFPHAVSRAYFNFLYARKGWEDFLQAYPHDMILLTTQANVLISLAGLPDWVEAYRDVECVLLVRRGFLQGR